MSGESESGACRGPFSVVLGIAQDAGVPHVGCGRPCCERAWTDLSARFLPACLGIIDPGTGLAWLLDATPALPEQLWRLQNRPGTGEKPVLSGVLPTHAHLGHYLGLAFLSREALASRGVKVFALPRMAAFLRRSGPYDRLIAEGRIVLTEIAQDREFDLCEGVSVRAVAVPHRDEDSETAAFFVRGKRRSLLYMPDVDSWDLLDARGTPVEGMIAKVDRAYVDATFFDLSEVGGAKGVPHPPVSASIERFSKLDQGARSKIAFIHLNHTNPLLHGDCAQARAVISASMRIAREGEEFDL